MAALDGPRRFLEGGAIIFQALFRWFEINSYIATKLIVPIEQLIFFALLASFTAGPGRIQYLVVGNCIMLAGLGGIWAALTIGEERSTGTLPLLIASPANRLLNFLQRGLGHVVDSLISVSFALAFAVLVFHVDFTRAKYGALLASVLVAVISSIGLGLLLGAFALAFVDMYFVTNVVYFGLLVIAGVNFPVTDLPGWLQPLSQAAPFTHSVAAARAAINGASAQTVMLPLLFELGVAACYLIVGYVFMRYLEGLVIRHGRLEAT
jgi:ABC-2 type transport system permease protein